jgi:hypothetical protein
MPREGVAVRLSSFYVIPCSNRARNQAQLLRHSSCYVAPAAILLVSVVSCIPSTPPCIARQNTFPCTTACSVAAHQRLA